MTGGDLVFTCTGRGTHDTTETVMTVGPVTAGHPPRSKVPPMFDGTRLSLPSHMEVACPECGRTLRLGRRLQHCAIAAAEQGIAEIDISQPLF
jgi:hypothetical protein